MFEAFSTWLRHRKEDRFFRKAFVRPVGERRPLHGFQRFPCPCCGLPTISEPGIYDICAVCWWEDDGREGDSPFSPNHMPLAQAKINFNRYLSMFDPVTEPAGIADTAEQKALKRSLVGRFELLRSDTDSGAQDRLRKEIVALVYEIQSQR